MKIAAFYENIKLGIETSGVTYEEALTKLKGDGLELLYADYKILKQDYDFLIPIIEKLDIGFEGLYGFFDFAHDSEDESYKECIDLCEKAGGKNVLLIPGLVFPGEEEKSESLINEMKAGLERAVEYAKGTGVTVTLEDFDAPIAPYNCIKGMKWFMENTKGLKCAYDSGNFVMYSEDELKAFEELKDYIVTFHVKDRSRTQLFPGDKEKICADGSKVYPCTVGKGYLRIDEIIKRLSDMNYDGGLIAEMYDCDENVMLEEMSYSIKYLKSVIAKL